MLRHLPLAGFAVPRGQAASGDGPAPTPTYTVFLGDPDPAVGGVVELGGFVDPGSNDVVLCCFLTSLGSGPQDDDEFDITVVTGTYAGGGGALLFFTPDSSGSFLLEVTLLNGTITPTAFVTAGGASFATLASKALDFT